jgi:hypothetical protein
MKLGEMLVREGKLTSAELEDTLKGQAIFGGRFGTNLIEMGFLDEGELTHFLSRKAGVPHASADQLMNIPPQVIRLLPEEVVRKYRVVPVALNNKKLSLAMTDPWDFAAIDEISFSTGYIVVPLITPELRLICAQEKYYNIKRELRYIPVAGGGRSRGRMSQVTSSAAEAAPAPTQQAAPAALSRQPVSVHDESDYFDLPLLEELESFSDPNEPQIQAPAPASLRSNEPPLELNAELSLEGALQGLTEALAPAVPRASEPPPEPEQDYTLEGLLLGLTRAPDRNNVAALLVGYTARLFNRSALFMIKGDQATGWIAQVGTKLLPGFETLEVDLDEPSVLREIAHSKSPYLGQLPISPSNSRISAALGGEFSGNQLLAPLMMMGRVVAILYVDGGARRLEESVPELQKLLTKVSMAFEILILKNKILSI